MSVLSIQGSGYPIGSVSGKNIRNVFGQGGESGRASSAFGGNYHGTLKMGYLHSGFSPVSGQELHMKYDESSTNDDPVMYVEGKDIHGKDFTKVDLYRKINSVMEEMIKRTGNRHI